MSQEDPNVHTLFRVKDCDLKRKGTNINTNQKEKGSASVQLHSDKKTNLYSTFNFTRKQKHSQSCVLLKQFLIDDMISVELLKISSYLWVLYFPSFDILCVYVPIKTLDGLHQLPEINICYV